MSKIKFNRIFTFPDPVNEVAARAVAFGVVVLAVGFCLTQNLLILLLLCYGFFARVLSGPNFSPLGLLSTKVVAPKLKQFAHSVPGKPKRFAQGIGTVFSLTSLVLFLLGATQAAVLLIGILAFFAFLESFLAFCVGCKIFAFLMRLGLVSDSYCVECADIWLRNPDKLKSISQ